MGLTDDRRHAFERARPWTALVLPPFAWLLFEYGAGTAMGHACAAVGSWLGPAWGAASLVACAGAAAIALPAARLADKRDPPTRPWLARAGMLGAAMFGLAIAFQTLATLIVPSCVR